MIAAKSGKKKGSGLPRVLVVDDDPVLLELVRDIVTDKFPCEIVEAATVAEARQRLAGQKVELLVTDMNLPDGQGTALIKSLHEKHPSAAAIVMTGLPTVDNAIGALRDGAIDFVPKPFSADALAERVRTALERQAAAAKHARRHGRLKDAVKRLNEARKVVSKKVDLLCNDLVSAYGELSRQLDVVRTQEGFRKTLAEAQDLEQLLCHAMDWMLRQMGYSNVAVWLASDEGPCQLGAYIKYTITGDPQFTDSMQHGLLPLIHRESFVHLKQPGDVAQHLTPAELDYLGGQTILGANCTYLGETLAAVVLFRDSKSPFSEDDAAVLKAISPLFAVALAQVVRSGAGGEQQDADGNVIDEDHNGHDDDRKSRRDDDWWKRGEAPPF